MVNGILFYLFVLRILHCQNNFFFVLQMLFVTYMHNGLAEVITQIAENNVKIQWPSKFHCRSVRCRRSASKSLCLDRVEKKKTSLCYNDRQIAVHSAVRFEKELLNNYLQFHCKAECHHHITQLYSTYISCTTAYYCRLHHSFGFMSCKIKM